MQQINSIQKFYQRYKLVRYLKFGGYRKNRKKLIKIAKFELPRKIHNVSYGVILQIDRHQHLLSAILKIVQQFGLLGDVSNRHRKFKRSFKL